MKSTTLVALFCTTLLFSCGNETPRTISSEKESIPESNTTSSAEPVTKTTHEGDYYSGMFEAIGDIKYENAPTISNKISILFEQIENGQVKGKSIVAGNERPFKGTYTQEGSKLRLVIKEPGDDPYDGQFEAILDKATQTIQGKWRAFDHMLSVTEREYNLKLTHFSYKPEIRLPENLVGAELYDNNTIKEEPGPYEAITADILKLNPSTSALKKSDIENLYKGDLEIIRNSIYARHGYSFKNRRMRYLFDHFVEWYIPVTTDVRNQLTAIEKENIELLKRYEKHADKYYDEFSR